MSKFKSQGFRKTFKNARKGLRIVLKSERNIRIHFLVGTLALLCGAELKLSIIELCIVLLAIALVVGFEMINSAIEFSLDAVFHNKYSTLVGMAKDISAGAVMFATFIAIAIGLLIFIPPILALIYQYI
ncbi:MAG: diacylglycerol kinase family protein [Candidatus Gastranaerophilaceae bacterium]|nr:diacylglycerol kinase family protein [Candidatus Gastranaerophilaceae bacterium]